MSKARAYMPKTLVPTPNGEAPLFEAQRRSA